MTDQANALLFSVRRSVRYHNRRCQFFDTLNTWCKFLTALSGTATVAVVLSKAAPQLAVASACLVTLFSVADLVINSSDRSKAHQDFARQFGDLEKDMVRATEITAAELASFTERRLSIEQSEPPVLNILNLICHNDVCRAMGREHRHQVEIKWYQRLLSQFVDVNLHAIQARNRC